MARVLITHDNIHKVGRIRRLVTDASVKLGQRNETRVATCPAEAMKALNREQFDLIIIPEWMEMLSDLSLLAAFARREQPRAFIILLGLDYNEPGGAGHDDFMADPVYQEDFGTLGEKIKDALRPTP